MRQIVSLVLASFRIYILISVMLGIGLPGISAGPLPVKGCADDGAVRLDAAAHAGIFRFDARLAPKSEGEACCQKGS